MTRVRKFLPENRLAKVLEDPNGLLFGHALKKAATNLENVRDKHVAMLDAKLGMLAPLSAAGLAGAGDADDVYRLAREIRADAGMFGLKDVSRAAHSLCELMVATRPPKQLWEGIAVHVHAIAALRQPTKGAPAAREALLEGLEKISRPPTG